MNSTTDFREIFRAIAKDDLSSLKNLVEVRGVPVTLVNARHQITSHFAVERGNLEILKFLLTRNASLASVRNQWDENILHVAVKKGALPIVKFLVDDYKIDLNSTDNLLVGDSVLHIAADAGRLNVLEYLLEEKRVDVNARNQLGEPPLFLAASKCHSDVVRYLVERRNADPTLVDFKECNILHISSTLGDLTIPKYLLDERKVNIDVNWRNVFGKTVLLNAVRYNSLAFVKYLVEEKHANISIADNGGKTPLHEAVNDENAAMIKYLLERGADPGCKDEEGKTPVQLTEDPRLIKYFTKVVAGNRSRRNAYSIQELYDGGGDVIRIENRITSRVDSGASRSNWEYSGLNNLLLLANTCLGYMGWREMSGVLPKDERDLVDVIDLDLLDAKL